LNIEAYLQAPRGYNLFMSGTDVPRRAILRGVAAAAVLPSSLLTPPAGAQQTGAQPDPDLGFKDTPMLPNTTRTGLSRA
jgi:hypothetical protein